jgi:type IV pilus assembly protein PilE
MMKQNQISSERSARRPGLEMRGFSLMELFVTVSIVGILSTIALPNYTNYVERSRRADGYQALTAILQSQERHFANQYTYTSDLTELGYSSSAGLLTPEENYRITATRCGQGATNAIGRCVLITAVAQGGQTNDGDITLSSRGQKSLGSYAYWPDR